jgi:hypothetical protein
MILLLFTRKSAAFGGEREGELGHSPRTQSGGLPSSCTSCFYESDCTSCFYESDCTSCFYESDCTSCFYESDRVLTVSLQSACTLGIVLSETEDVDTQGDTYNTCDD